MTRLNPQDYIQKYGGKAGGYFYLKDLGGFEKHLLPAVYLAAGQEFSGVEKDAKELFAHSEELIARGTHPGDHEGLVDVLFTYPHIETLEELADAIGEIRLHAKSNRIISYAKYDGVNNYNGDIGILIQVMNHSRPGSSKRRGSMVEHPHEKGTYIVEVVENYTGDNDLVHSYVLRADAVWNGKEFMDFDDCFVTDDVLLSLPTCKHELINIIELYEKVRDSGFIQADASFQMEFGLHGIGEMEVLHADSIFFYQARLFKKFQEPAFEFEGAGVDKGIKYRCFGMTPESGIVLPAIRGNLDFSVDEGLIDNLNECEEPFAWLDCVTQGSRPLTIRPINLKAYVPVHPNFAILEHNVYRWTQKADISIFASRLTDYFLNFSDCNDKVRIISNGLFHGIEKVK